MSDNRSMKYAEILSKIIQVETISSRESQDIAKFLKFHEVLRQTYPNLFKVAEVENFDGSLLLKWKGTNSSLKPIILMNHHDVVEASGEWTHPPFSGAIADGKVWGRGTLDTKGGMAMMFQAAEELIREGYTPKRDTYFVTACTEEIGGEGGDAISIELQKRGIKFHMVLDEGGMIMYDPIGGADGTFAMIGVGEKGYVDLKFIAKSNGGHASAPGKNTPLVRLGKFMAEAEKAECFEVHMSDTVKEMLTRFSPTMSGVMKTACSNVNAFKPVLKKVMPMISPAGAALLRTTLAFTMAKGADGANVLPQEASIVGNMRFIQHQPNDASIECISKVAAKYDIETEVLYQDYPCPVIDFKGEEFKIVEETINEIYPGIGVCPYVMTGGTDAKYYTPVCENAIRFAPLYIDPQQYSSIHGLNENIYQGTLPMGVDFYKTIIKKCNK